MSEQKRIILIACAAKKHPEAKPVEQLYISQLFQKSWNWAQTLPHDAIYILSAKHGLVKPGTMIEPYNVTLKNMSSDERYTWATQVRQALAREGFDLKTDHFTFLAGMAYRDYLSSYMKYYDVPMEGLGIGQQLGYLTDRLAWKP